VLCRRGAGEDGHGQEPGDGDGDHGRQGPAGEAPQEAAALCGRGAGQGGQGQGREAAAGRRKDKDKDAATKKLTAELEAWKAAFYDQQSLTNAEFMLSDENPNACAVM